MSIGPSKRVQEDDKENERDGTLDKRPRLQESVTTTTDSTSSNNPKRSSTSKRPRPQPRFKAQAAQSKANVSPPILSPAPVASIGTPSTFQMSSVTTTTQTPAVNTVPTPMPFAQVPTKTPTLVAPTSAHASVITPTSIPTTSAQPLDIQMQDPSSGVSADASTMALPTTVATTSGPTRELDVETRRSQGASMSPVPVASELEFLAPGEEKNGPDGTSVSIASFMENLLMTTRTRTPTMMTPHRVRITTQTSLQGA
jgi:hypothetical protein